MTTPARTAKDWWLYKGTGKPHKAIKRLPDPPPWRSQREASFIKRELELDVKDDPVHFQASDEEVELVNMALYLRRPLLVTGSPGTGKSSLARAVAHELGLGKPLYWPISTRTPLLEGLYRYDAIGRLQEAAQRQASGPGAKEEPRITDFLRLGPLGTALAPWEYPRVLLIDEIDKGDVDLPNDLLHVLEEGQFEIPELTRTATADTKLEVKTQDGAHLIPVKDGWVRSHAFPFIVLTSNGEREFPPAFLRRCVQLDMKEPDETKLTAIVTAHLGPAITREQEPLIQKLIQAFLQHRDKKTLATDQLLNAVYLVTRGNGAGNDVEQLLESLFKNLRAPGGA
ncbi:MAG: AAA family ATPase [Archangium sp.]